MVKQTDANGFWLIEDNPITKEGVFPYLGKQISRELEPDKIYMVYRPYEELDNPETVASFQAVPFIDEHEMLGDGFTKYDDRPAGGVLFNVSGKNGTLVGDFKIFSEKLKDEIQNGKKELSLGYLCDYDIQSGSWNGEYYDAIQRNIRGNHVALVNKGRMGSDVRVYDKAITMDALDIEIPSIDGCPNESGDNSSSVNNGVNKMAEEKTGMDADKREAIREVMAIAAKPDSDFQGGEEEKIETIAKILERSEYAPSEAKTEDEDVEEVKEEVVEKKVEDKCGKDDDDIADKREAIREVMAIAAKPASEFAGGEEEKERTIAKIMERSEYSKSEAGTSNDEEVKKSMDAMPKQILEMISRRNELVKAVEPMIGSFACDSMTDIDVAEYACGKLGLKATKSEAPLVLRGYLAANKGTSNKTYGLDSAIVRKSGVDKATEKYLKGE